MKLIKIRKRLESKLESMRTMVKRERKLLQTSALAQKIAYESEWNRKFNEIKQRLEYENKQICCSCVELLRDFYDASEEINEKSAQKVLMRAKEELDKLTKSDLAIRRLMNIKQNQTTEGAVAKLLLSRNCL